MLQIPLSPVPRQALSVTIDGAYWQLTLYTSMEFVCIDIMRNGVPVAYGIRCFAGLPLMPYEYMRAPEFGNFIFNEDADWAEFGNTCNLYYLTASEWQMYKTLEKDGLANVDYHITDKR